MNIDFTPLLRRHFIKRARRTLDWKNSGRDVQLDVLGFLLRAAAHTEIGYTHGFSDISTARDIYQAYRNIVEPVVYEDIRSSVMRMIGGEKDVLWRGKCFDYAQSSGTSGGKSKYIPITTDSLRLNHYRGAEDAVAHYINSNPGSRIFSGKAMILGGSFANELSSAPANVRIGDLSATLIDKITPLAELVRVPSKKIALMADWEEKLPMLVKRALKENVTNISGVPSWFLTVIKRMLEAKSVSSLAGIWPNLEVFFHGGISFKPYREEYLKITEGCPMHFFETYNASEGFFATQSDLDEKSMLLILDSGIFYEFMPIGKSDAEIVPMWEVETDRVYELVISAANGLWRYKTGDTVRIHSTNPLKITIEGRTKSFINAFGEELMEANADTALSRVCRQTGAMIRNYTAAPIYASDQKKGRHQWVIEWEKQPVDTESFARMLDKELQNVNSDYQAKRSHSIFLDGPLVTSAPDGLFDRWLKSEGSHKLGGQRKVPRLSNDRKILDQLLELSMEMSAQR